MYISQQNDVCSLWIAGMAGMAGCGCCLDDIGYPKAYPNIHIPPISVGSMWYVRSANQVIQIESSLVKIMRPVSKE